MPALGVTLVFVLVSYLLEVVGFDLAVGGLDLRLLAVPLRADQAAADGQLHLFDVALLGGVLVVAVVYAWVVFPRRDIAAPS